MVTITAAVGAASPAPDLNAELPKRNVDPTFDIDIYDHQKGEDNAGQNANGDHFSAPVMTRSPKVELSVDEKHEALTLFMENEKRKQYLARKKGDEARVEALRAGLYAAETKYNIQYRPGEYTKKNVDRFRAAQLGIAKWHGEETKASKVMQQPGINIENVGGMNKDLRNRMLKHAKPYLNTYPGMKRPDSALVEWERLTKQQRKKIPNSPSQGSRAGSRSSSRKQGSTRSRPSRESGRVSRGSMRPRSPRDERAAGDKALKERQGTLSLMRKSAKLPSGRAGESSSQRPSTVWSSAEGDQQGVLSLLNKVKSSIPPSHERAHQSPRPPSTKAPWRSYKASSGRQPKTGRVLMSLVESFKLSSKLSEKNWPKQWSRLRKDGFSRIGLVNTKESFFAFFSIVLDHFLHDSYLFLT